MNRYDAILFDFDGVLADTEPLHYACWAEILAPAGLHLDWETYRRDCIGVSDRAMLELFAARAERPPAVESLLPLYEVKKELFRRRIAEMDVCRPETLALLHGLRDYRLAVVTSSGRLEVEPVLERSGLATCLQAAVYGGDVARLKPAPDPYLRAAELLRATHPLVVEDSEAGVASARAAGFDVIRVSSPAQVAEAVRARIS
ncbi:MAG: HAD family phosphatase [Acidobacteria bacterium]|nr:HAD family phosphatase [Acidobacteriota bacterium]